MDWESFFEKQEKKWRRGRGRRMKRIHPRNKRQTKRFWFQFSKCVCVCVCVWATTQVVSSINMMEEEEKQFTSCSWWSQETVFSLSPFSSFFRFPFHWLFLKQRSSLDRSREGALQQATVGNYFCAKFIYEPSGTLRYLMSRLNDAITFICRAICWLPCSLRARNAGEKVFSDEEL